MPHGRGPPEMLSVAFIDSFSPRPYDADTMREGALGGTEASIVRLAEGLAGRARVSVFQRAASGDVESRSGVRYRAMGDLDHLAREDRHDFVVIVNSPKILAYWRRRNPDSDLLLWLHNYPGRHARDLGKTVERCDARLVTVSRSHERVIRLFARRMSGVELGERLLSIYNPLEPLEADDTPRDPDKLIFASSPHKGIEQVLAAFETVRRARPSAWLALANPGYWRDERASGRYGVRFLGRLSHPELIRELRSSFCVFYPQSRFAETFGLVMAEANAVGTPVLAHRELGANDEVLSDGAQLVAADDQDAVVSRMLDWWSNGPPVVRRNPAFDVDRVAENWLDLFERRSRNDQRSLVQMVR